MSANFEKTASGDLLVHDSETFRLHLVRTDSNNPRHHGLRETAAPFLLTAAAEPGDQIVYSLPFGFCATWRLDAEQASQTLIEFSGGVDLIAETFHPYDKALLRVRGGLPHRWQLGDDSFDTDALPTFEDLIRELLGRRMPQLRNGEFTDWGYAPVSVEVVEGSWTGELAHLQFAATIENGVATGFTFAPELMPEPFPSPKY